MGAEFRTYRRSDGFFSDPSVLYERPLAPGTFLTKVPVVRSIDLRTGMVVAVTEEHVFVVWNGWRSDERVQDGELRKRMGIPNAKERKRAQWERKKKERELARISSQGTST